MCVWTLANVCFSMQRHSNILLSSSFINMAKSQLIMYWYVLVIALMSALFAHFFVCSFVCLFGAFVILFLRLLLCHIL